MMTLAQERPLYATETVFGTKFRLNYHRLTLVLIYTLFCLIYLYPRLEIKHLEKEIKKSKRTILRLC